MRSTSKRKGGLMVAVLVGLCGAVQAQSSLQLRMSLSYEGAPARQVFEAISDVLGYRLQMDERVTGAVTLNVRNVTAETVLRAICESIGCRWRIDAGTLDVDHDAAAAGGAPGGADPYANVRVSDVHEDLPVQIHWNAAPAGVALKALAGMLGAELSLDRSLTEKRITLSLEKDTTRAALNAICEQAACRWRLADGPKRILRVAAAPAAASTGQHSASAAFAPDIARPQDPGVTAPKLLSSARPRYSADAMRAKVQGAVVMECVVEPDGTVGDVRVITSLDRVHGLDDEAVAAVRLYLFQPGTRNGTPIPVVVLISVAFTLR